MNNIDASYDIAVALRKACVKGTHSYHTVVPTMKKAVEYAEKNRIKPSEMMDMAIIEFLEKRGIGIEDIPGAIIDMETKPE